MTEREDQNWTRLSGRVFYTCTLVKYFCLLQGLGKEVNKTLAELYRSFSRVAALVSTAEANICCEELCTRILSVDKDWKNKVGTNERRKNGHKQVKVSWIHNNISCFFNNKFLFFPQDLTFVDTLVNLAGVAIECLDFSTPGLFAMATTAAGKSPNTTPTKWNKRLQKPMGNFTSVVNLAAKLLSTCERTSDSKVAVLMCHITPHSFLPSDILLTTELYS